MLVLKSTPVGKGVFTTVRIEPGEVVARFGGPVKRGAELASGWEEDHALQIGPDLYLGPSGGLDDLINHSCDPNGGIRIEGPKVEFVAIRVIHPGEELTFDYSTTMSKDRWRMVCRCGASGCRGLVREFRFLSAAVRARYASLGIVPAYVLDEAPALDAVASL